MFNFCSLYSGSSGNSLFVESENTKLLVDAGISSKKIETALTNLEIDPSSINGILITHEHSDHVQGLGTFAKKFNLPVYVNQKTLDAMPNQKDKISEKNIKIIKNEEKFEIGDLKIKPFSIPHDAANPCGFNIIHDNKKISIATDIGHMTNGIIKNLEDSIFIMLEANYDPEVLKFSKYPYILKSRIAGPTGHLPNEIAGKTIAHLLNSGLQQAILGHLSKESNFPELAYKTVIDEVISSNYDENSLKLSVASRDIPGNKIII
ncbi:beta-lactamase domain protein [Clostridium sp. CAG:575]|nr:beta-lactamase domain protein [Clostridium sp. CAG:575]